MKLKFDQKGQVSRLLLVLAIIVLVAVVIVYLVVGMAERPAAPVENPTQNIPQPHYEQTLGNIKFVFIESRDLGSVLRASQRINQASSWVKDVITTERFIIVTIGAQNKGKENIENRAWDIGNIVDDEGRNFEPSDGYTIDAWLSEDNSCGVLLKPEFDPVPCTKIYEVSKISTGLKIMVMSGKNNEPNKISSGDFDQELIDLIIK